jgi:hypothetical protein
VLKKEMTEEKFLEIARAKYAEIKQLNTAPTFLDYEKGFVDLWMDLGREIVQANLGEPGKDRRKKTNQNVFWTSRSKEVASLHL